MSYLPSAGIVRFRFNGFCKLRISALRLPEVGMSIGPCREGGKGGIDRSGIRGAQVGKRHITSRTFRRNL